jgi:hypothetical protein
MEMHLIYMENFDISRREGKMAQDPPMADTNLLIYIELAWQATSISSFNNKASSGVATSDTMRVTP